MTHLDLFLQKGPATTSAGDPPTPASISTSLTALRQTVLLDGIPSSPDGLSDLRIYIWLILLNCPPTPTAHYLDLVGHGASPAYAKIRDDTFRTLTTDPLFRRRVSENSLTRVLNAVAWRVGEREEGRRRGWMSPPTLSLGLSLNLGGSSGGGTLGVPPDNTTDIFHSPGSITSATNGLLPRTTHGTSITASSDAGETASIATAPHTSVGYVQGMNVLAAPFLYAARSEVEAFSALDALLTSELPAYIHPDMSGVHRGLALVDRILEIVDPKLSQHLLSKGMKAEIYAFPSVLTLCACTPPLPEVLRWWDFLFAWGTGLNLVGIVGQLVLGRDALLGSASPKPDFKPLRAREVIDLTVCLARKIPEDVYAEVLGHAR